MKQTLTPQQWFDENVDMEKLEQSIISAMVEAVQYDNCEDDTYVALVHDIISGANGRYIPYLALEYFGYEDVNKDNDSYQYSDEVIYELDDFVAELTNLINENLSIYISVSFGYWDADGTWCLMAYMSKSEYEEDKEDSYKFISELLEVE